MNLEDAILSTINEIQVVKEGDSQSQKDQKPFKVAERTSITSDVTNQPTFAKVSQKPTVENLSETKSHIIERKFLEDLRERILVLFEGFQSPNNKNIEAKLDLTLNFLEHLLAKIDHELDNKGRT